MTQQEKVDTVRALLDSDENENLIIVMLKKAEKAIQNRMYPFRLPSGMETFVVPEKYEMLQCDLALRYISKMGGEGELLHIENGIDRHYTSSNEEDLLSEVMQVI